MLNAGLFAAAHDPQGGANHPRNPPPTTTTHMAIFSFLLSIHVILGIADLPKGLHPEQCGLCTYTSPTRWSACTAPRGSSPPPPRGGGQGSAPSPSRPSDSFEMRLGHQAECKPEGESFVWASYIEQTLRLAMSDHPRSQQVARNVGSRCSCLPHSPH